MNYEDFCTTLNELSAQYNLNNIKPMVLEEILTYIQQNNKQFIDYVVKTLKVPNLSLISSQLLQKDMHSKAQCAYAKCSPKQRQQLLRIILEIISTNKDQNVIKSLISCLSYVFKELMNKNEQTEPIKQFIQQATNCETQSFQQIAGQIAQQITNINYRLNQVYIDQIYDIISIISYNPNIVVYAFKSLCNILQDADEPPVKIINALMVLVCQINKSNEVNNIKEANQSLVELLETNGSVLRDNIPEILEITSKMIESDDNTLITIGLQLYSNISDPYYGIEPSTSDIDMLMKIMFGSITNLLKVSEQKEHSLLNAEDYEDFYNNSIEANISETIYRTLTNYFDQIYDRIMQFDTFDESELYQFLFFAGAIFQTNDNRCDEINEIHTVLDEAAGQWSQLGIVTQHKLLHTYKQLVKYFPECANGVDTYIQENINQIFSLEQNCNPIMYNAIDLISTILEAKDYLISEEINSLILSILDFNPQNKCGSGSIEKQKIICIENFIKLQQKKKPHPNLIQFRDQLVQKFTNWNGLENIRLYSQMIGFFKQYRMVYNLDLQFNSHFEVISKQIIGLFILTAQQLYPNYSDLNQQENQDTNVLISSTLNFMEQLCYLNSNIFIADFQSIVELLIMILNTPLYTESKLDVDKSEFRSYLIEQLQSTYNIVSEFFINLPQQSKKYAKQIFDSILSKGEINQYNFDRQVKVFASYINCFDKKEAVPIFDEIVHIFMEASNSENCAASQCKILKEYQKFINFTCQKGILNFENAVIILDIIFKTVKNTDKCFERYLLSADDRESNMPVDYERGEYCRFGDTVKDSIGLLVSLFSEAERHKFCDAIIMRSKSLKNTPLKLYVIRGVAKHLDEPLRTALFEENGDRIIQKLSCDVLFRGELEFLFDAILQCPTLPLSQLPELLSIQSAILCDERSINDFIPLLIIFAFKLLQQQSQIQNLEIVTTTLSKELINIMKAILQKFIIIEEVFPAISTFLIDKLINTKLFSEENYDMVYTIIFDNVKDLQIIPQIVQFKNAIQNHYVGIAKLVNKNGSKMLSSFTQDGGDCMCSVVE